MKSDGYQCIFIIHMNCFSFNKIVFKLDVNPKSQIMETIFIPE